MSAPDHSVLIELETAVAAEGWKCPTCDAPLDGTESSRCGSCGRDFTVVVVQGAGHALVAWSWVTTIALLSGASACAVLVHLRTGIEYDWDYGDLLFFGREALLLWCQLMLLVTVWILALGKPRTLWRRAIDIAWTCGLSAVAAAVLWMRAWILF